MRPVEPGDRDFLLRVYGSTRAEELAAVPWDGEQKDGFLRMQFEAQASWYEKHYDGATFDVVLVDGEPAGRLYVHRGAQEIRIVDIALLPEFRSHGIGTRLLEPILAEATEREVPVAIHVERFNPALALYRRLGFVAVAEDTVYLKLERPPGT
ncbi:MAG: hypothetical protein QOG81_726 [Gaiellaceae bacterium]|nr:hypothetical protein [Gaiellaceae bacterium]